MWFLVASVTPWATGMGWKAAGEFGTRHASWLIS